MKATDHTHAHTEALKLFPPAALTAPPDCKRCQDYAQRRDTATGPLRGTLVTDMQVLMKRCAQAGHRSRAAGSRSEKSCSRVGLCPGSGNCLRVHR
ncbi:hypothetical protein ACFV9E_36345 [Streptomyces sp. NPDC059835]|uniref:hypothetical protein n=1 Tax=Streptomyces sp. NPDC059835 TaxID=3346967 RepID=UPI0036565947